MTTVNVSYVYTCACGKDPMRGYLKTGDWAAQLMLEMLDKAWGESHNRPGCTPPDKARTVTPRTKSRSGGGRG